MKNKPGILIALLVSGALLSGCHLARFLKWGFADYDDYEKFPKVKLEKSTHPLPFLEDEDQDSKISFPQSIEVGKDRFSFEEGLRESSTYAFLVIRNDSILYEYYQEPLGIAIQGPSFSVAKSFVSTLVGAALLEGKIDSLQAPITAYLDLSDKKEYDEISIEDLLTMQSGIQFSESYYNPFSDISKLYYGKNIKKSLERIRINRPPGRGFKYHSFNTQLLAFIFEEATGMSIDRYAQLKLWEPLGMENPGFWSLDSEKHQTVKAYCCLNATARDFAKLGRLYLNQGKQGGKQIISENWVKECSDFDRGGWYIYSYQWWEGSKNYQDMTAIGVLDQYLYVNFDENMIMVRLGNKGKGDWPDVFEALVDLNQQLKPKP